jgi:hypothetical protein
MSNAARSAREARSKRRQAIIDEVPAAPAPIVAPPTGKRKTGGSSSGSKIKKRQRQEPAKDEPVTKVKFLTGTLYIYRGQQRRVEFVRRV